MTKRRPAEKWKEVACTEDTERRKTWSRLSERKGETEAQRTIAWRRTTTAEDRRQSESGKRVECVERVEAESPAQERSCQGLARGNGNGQITANKRRQRNCDQRWPLRTCGRGRQSLQVTVRPRLLFRSRQTLTISASVSHTECILIDVAGPSSLSSVRLLFICRPSAVRPPSGFS